MGRRHGTAHLFAAMISEPFEAGFLHRPENPSGDVLILTHGAGSNCNAPLLVAVATEFAAAGLVVYRYDLPFRRKRPHGPPFPASAAADREGIRAAIQVARSFASGKVVAGGHSYGGRQTSMAAADDPQLGDGLLLLSYPLHPPNRPEQMRTAHFPNLRIPALFFHGAKDGFGTEEEMRDALKQIPAPSDLVMVEGAGHDLGRVPARLAPVIRARAESFLLHRTL
jgi:predicted alpha/beta-hydrolase family hydrolase